jgi:hypothetical protein
VGESLHVSVNMCRVGSDRSKSVVSILQNYDSDSLLGFCHDHALILYVYLPNDNGEDESVLTVCGAVASLPLHQVDVLLTKVLVLRQFL